MAAWRPAIAAVTLCLASGGPPPEQCSAGEGAALGDAAGAEALLQRRAIRAGGALLEDAWEPDGAGDAGEPGGAGGGAIGSADPGPVGSPGRAPPPGLGCLEDFFVQEDLCRLRTFQDAKTVVGEYCAEEHDVSFCEMLENVVFEAFHEKLSQRIHPDQALCEELADLASAEGAWLRGQRAALLARGAGSATNDGAEVSQSAGAFDQTAELKTCGKACRGCRRAGRSWGCRRGVCECAE